jgi:CTP synthase (UTP-ammonia lyase)
MSESRNTQACSLQNESLEIIVQQDSLAYRLYGNHKATEKFNCNFSVNEQHKEHFHNSALRPVGKNLTGDVRMIELSDPPFYLAMLFQPQLAAPNSSGHPVIKEF